MKYNSEVGEGLTKGDSQYGKMVHELHEKALIEELRNCQVKSV